MKIKEEKQLLKQFKKNLKTCLLDSTYKDAEILIQINDNKELIKLIRKWLSE